MLSPRMLVNLFLLRRQKRDKCYISRKAMRRGLTLTAFDIIYALIDKSDRKLFRQALSQVTVCTIFSLLNL